MNARDAALVSKAHEMKRLMAAESYPDIVRENCVLTELQNAHDECTQRLELHVGKCIDCIKYKPHGLGARIEQISERLESVDVDLEAQRARHIRGEHIDAGAVHVSPKVDRMIRVHLVTRYLANCNK